MCQIRLFESVSERGLALLENILLESTVILDGYTSEAKVNEVEIVGIDPVIFNIVDNEFNIGGNPYWLYGG